MIVMVVIILGEHLFLQQSFELRWGAAQSAGSGPTSIQDALLKIQHEKERDTPYPVWT